MSVRRKHSLLVWLAPILGAKVDYRRVRWIWHMPILNILTENIQMNILYQWVICSAKTHSLNRGPLVKVQCHFHA